MQLKRIRSAQQPISLVRRVPRATVVHLAQGTVGVWTLASGIPTIFLYPMLVHTTADHPASNPLQTFKSFAKLQILCKDSKLYACFDCAARDVTA